MRSIRILSLSLLTAAAFAPSAFAQDYSATDSTTDTASGKHFAVVGGVALLQPKNDPVEGIRKFDGGPAPTLSLSYYINDNWAVELWGAADKFNHRVRGVGNERLGTVEQQPIALSGQYHFGQADNVFRPFVGVGYYESNFSNEDLVAPGVTEHIGLENVQDAELGHLIHPRLVPHGAGIVHQRSDPAQFGVHMMKQRNHFIFDTDIRAHRNRLGTEAANLLEHAVGGFFIGVIVDAEAIALAGSQQCRLGADTTAAPGDDEDFVHACGLLIQPGV